MNGIRAILWWQGEGNTGDSGLPTSYTTKLIALTNNFIEDLGPSIPMVAYQIGQVFEDINPGAYKPVVQAIQNAAAAMPGSIILGPSLSDIDLTPTFKAGAPHVFDPANYSPTAGVHFITDTNLGIVADRVNTVLNGSIYKATANYIPLGNLDAISSSGLASGWAADRDSNGITVSFYLTNGARPGTFIGNTTTGIARPDVFGVEGYGAQSGFQFQIPEQFLTDGTKYKLDAYALDVNPSASPANNSLLFGSAKDLPVYVPKVGDLNGDGKVDMSDYNLIVSKFGNSYTIFDYNTLVGNYGK
jgi:hypothetical protein